MPAASIIVATRIPADLLTGTFWFVLAQVPEQPQNLVTLQWIVIVVLAGVVAFQYRQDAVKELRHETALREMADRNAAMLKELADRQETGEKEQEARYLALVERVFAFITTIGGSLEAINRTLAAESSAQKVLDRLAIIEERLPDAKRAGDKRSG